MGGAGRIGRWMRRASGRWLLPAVLGVAGSVAAAAIFGESVYPVGPFRLRAAWEPARQGVTELALPPLGSVAAKTHAGPMRVFASLESIDLAGLAAFLATDPHQEEQSVRRIVDQGTRAAGRFARRLVVVGTVGGGILSATVFLLLRRRFLWPGAVGALAGLVVLSGCLGLAWATYDPRAFRSPTFRGALESVPWVIDAVQEALAQGVELQARLATLARNVYEMYRKIGELPPPFALADSDVTVLHVSDFHNHPAAVKIARELAAAFDADFAVNTGDLTDFGTVVEAELLQGLRGFPVPQYFVTGNHETPQIAEALSLVDGLIVIDGRMVEAAGLRLLGVGDPGALVPSPASLTPAQARRLAQEINRSLEELDPPPDVVAVHNHRVAAAIRPGLVPLVLFGHSHTPGVVFRGGTAYVNAGTTGGAGVRGFEAEEPVRISLAVVYLQRRERVRVQAVDLIRLSPLAEGFTLERHLAPAD